MNLALNNRQQSETSEDDRLDAVFSALSDPVRRAILQQLEDGPGLVTELAAPFDISLQAVSRHIQVLVRAGLVTQERSGRIASCSLRVAPMYDAAVWLNRYTKYWQQSFDALAEFVRATRSPAPEKTKRTSRPKRKKASK